jgi:signal transduction histidine kinase
MSPDVRRLSLRGRLTAIAVLGVAVALAIGSVTLYAVLAYVSNRTLVDSGLATAHDVGTLVEQGRLPDPIPVTGTQIVQVVDDQNRVVSASGNADRLTAMLLPGEVQQVTSGRALTVSGSRVGLSSPLRVVGIRVPTGRASRSVLVAQQYDEVTHSARVLRTALLLTYPVLLAVLALIAWRVIGSTLRPVEALRSGAEKISGSGQGGPLPVPESTDEIHALAVTLNQMLDRLAASRARQRDFVADAAHELRSPLASMRTQLEVAQRLGEAPELSEDLLAEVHRLTGLVEDLLTLARADADLAPSAEPESFDAEALLHEVAGRYAGARVPVTVAARSGAVPSVTGNREDLRRVLANLADNAVRHAGSRVELAAAAEGACTLVTVTDDGPGVAPEDRERVFERFTRLDEARDRDVGGSGLGLAIVHELVRRAGGQTRLAEADGGGLRVEVRLPR